MKRQIQTFIRILLLTAVILFAGCNREKVERVNTPTLTEIVSEILLFSEKAQAETVPSTLYPAKNPYADLTITGTAPPPDYKGFPVLWIPDYDFELEPGIATFEADSIPIAPNHEEKLARYENLERKAFSEFRQKAEDITSQKRMIEMSEEVDMQLKDLRAEIMTEGMTPLNAAKYLMAHNINTALRLHYAQQAVDENPDDYHTHLVWITAQLILI